MFTRTKNGRRTDFASLIEEMKSLVQDGEQILGKGAKTFSKTPLPGTRYTERANQVVHEHPYQTIGVVFGLGVIVGALALGFLSNRDTLDNPYSE